MARPPVGALAPRHSVAGSGMAISRPTRSWDITIQGRRLACRSNRMAKPAAAHDGPERMSVIWPFVLGIVLVGLVAVVTVGSLLFRSAATQAQRAVSVNEVLQQAALAVSAEESAERQYLLEPGPEALQAHSQAEQALNSAMHSMTRSEARADQLLAERVLRENAGYVAGSQALFNAADRHETSDQVQMVDTTQVDPVFTRLEQEVSQAAAAHHAGAVAAVKSA